MTAPEIAPLMAVLSEQSMSHIPPANSDSQIPLLYPQPVLEPETASEPEIVSEPEVEPETASEPEVEQESAFESESNLLLLLRRWLEMLVCSGLGSTFASKLE